MKKKIYFCMLFFCFYLIVPAFATDWPSQQLSTKGAWGGATAGLGMSKCQLDNNPKTDVIIAWIDDPPKDNSLYYRIILNGNQLIKPSDSNLGSTNGWMNSGLGVASGNIDSNREPDVVFIWVDNPGNPDEIDGNAFHPKEAIEETNYIYYMIAYNLHKEGNQYKFRRKSKVFKKSENPGIGNRTQGLGAVLLNMDSDQSLDLLVAYIDAPSSTNYVHFKALMNINYNTSRGSKWIGCAKTISLGYNSQGLGMDLIKEWGSRIEVRIKGIYLQRWAVVLSAIDNPERNNRFYQSILHNIRLSDNKVTFNRAVTRTVKKKIGYANQGAALVALNEKEEQEHDIFGISDFYYYDFVHLAMDDPRGPNRIDTWIQQNAPPIVRVDQEQTSYGALLSAVRGKNARQSFKTKMSYLTEIEICYSFKVKDSKYMTIQLIDASNRVLAEKVIELSDRLIGWQGCEFDRPVKVSPGDKYFISVDRPPGFSWTREHNNPYKDGVSFYDGSSHPDIDFLFKTRGFKEDYPYE